MGAALGLLILVVFGKSILGLFGEEFVSGYVVTLILASAQLFVAGAGPVTRLLTISGHQDQCVIVFLASLVVVSVLMMVLVPLYGAEGAACAAAATIVLWSLSLRWVVKQKLGVYPRLIPLG